MDAAVFAAVATITAVAAILTVVIVAVVAAIKHRGVLRSSDLNLAVKGVQRAAVDGRARNLDQIAAADCEDLAADVVAGAVADVDRAGTIVFAAAGRGNELSLVVDRAVVERDRTTVVGDDAVGVVIFVGR